MTHAIRVHEYGDPEVLTWEEVKVGDPGPGQIRIKQTAIGLNFIDVYGRTGLYPQDELPFIPGMEGAGVVTAVGDGVRDLKVGRRVAYAGPIGAYAQERLIAAFITAQEEDPKRADWFRKLKAHANPDIGHGLKPQDTPWHRYEIQHLRFRRYMAKLLKKFGPCAPPEQEMRTMGESADEAQTEKLKLAS